METQKNASRIETMSNSGGLTQEQQARVNELVEALATLLVEAKRVGQDAIRARANVVLREMRNITGPEGLGAYRAAAVQRRDEMIRQAANAALAQRLQQQEFNDASTRAAAPTAANLAAIQAIQAANAAAAAALRTGTGAVRGLNDGPLPLAPPPPPPPPANSNIPLLQNGNNAVPFGPLVGIEGFCPIANGLNICYMNSAMQLLYSIPEFRIFFRNLTSEQIRDSEGDQETKIAIELLRRFFVEMIKAGTERRTLDLTRIQRPGEKNLYTLLINLLVARGGNRFQFGSQADAHEFFTILFGLVFFSNLTVDLRSMFTYQVVSQLTCRDASKPEARTDNLFDPYLLQIKGNKTANKIQDLLDESQGKEKVTDRTPLNSCNGQPPAFKQDTIKVLDTQKYMLLYISRKYDVRRPRLGRDGKQLVIQGKEQWYPGFQTVKDEKNITLTPSIRIDSLKFRLKQCVCHLGGAAGGHYISYSFDTKGNPSYYFSDDDVRPIAEADRATHQTRINKNATVVLYEKLPGQRRAEAVNVNVLANTPVALFGNSNANFGGRRKTHRRRHSKKKSTRRH